MRRWFLVLVICAWSHRTAKPLHGYGIALHKQHLVAQMFSKSVVHELATMHWTITNGKVAFRRYPFFIFKPFWKFKTSYANWSSRSMEELLNPRPFPHSSMRFRTMLTRCAPFSQTNSFYLEVFCKSRDMIDNTHTAYESLISVACPLPGKSHPRIQCEKLGEVL